ncbi:MAG: hypothetical protein AAFO69_06870 [Bacteroidota bacterium]
MISKIKKIEGSTIVDKKTQAKINGGWVVLLCEYGQEGQACLAPDGQIGQCNSRGICEC